MKSVLDVLSVRVAGIVLELLGVHQSVGERVDSVEDDDTGSEERSHRLGHRGRELLSEERHCDLLCNLKLTSGCGSQKPQKNAMTCLCYRASLLRQRPQISSHRYQ